jgi:hypothetical protein
MFTIYMKLTVVAGSVVVVVPVADKVKTMKVVYSRKESLLTT